MGTLANPRVGLGLAIAIGIHNVPEGLCVSVPIYYATKDRWAAFKWAFISGISEPIGAALGWLILARVRPPQTAVALGRALLLLQRFTRGDN